MPGIGERFETDKPVLQNLRRSSVSGFPNHIVYDTPLADGIIVYRVLHASRDQSAALDGDDRSKDL
jgi:hypothetical protein